MLTEVTTATGTYAVEYVDPHTLKPRDRIVAPNRDGDMQLWTVRSAHGVVVSVEERPMLVRVPFGGVHRVAEMMR